MPEPTTEQWQAIQAELFAGRKIQAIKLYREAAACGLAEAKEAMDAYATKLYQQAPERFTQDPNKSGCSVRAAVFLLTIGAGVAILCFS
jgi:ribosomal protein L7/L12